MKTIWKYELRITDKQEIQVPDKAIVLDVQIQHEVLCLWAFIDSEEKKIIKTIYVVGTGNPFPEEVDPIMDYRGTVQQFNGKLVWHIFIS